VRHLVANVMRWWRPGPARTALPVPYEIVCSCGQIVNGTRQPVFQRVPCTACGRDLFVLPASHTAQVPPPADTSTPPSPFKRTALLAAVPLGLGVVGGLLILFFSLGRTPTEESAQNQTLTTEAIVARMAAGRQQMRQGNFRLASSELQAARGMRDEQPDLLDIAQLRQLEQLARQADLLADLLTEPLEEILRHAAGVRDKEWQLDFDQRHRGKSVVLDTPVRRSIEGRLELGYVVLVDQQVAQVRVENLTLLSQFPVKDGQRLIFGARLDSMKLQDGGRGWVVRFQPESGVLITDAETAGICCSDFRDAAAVQVLAAQADWISRQPIQLSRKK
jgi:hypothetical protein